MDYIKLVHASAIISMKQWVKIVNDRVSILKTSVSNHFSLVWLCLYHDKKLLLCCPCNISITFIFRLAQPTTSVQYLQSRCSICGCLPGHYKTGHHWRHKLHSLCWLGRLCALPTRNDLWTARKGDTPTTLPCEFSIVLATKRWGIKRRRRI